MNISVHLLPEHVAPQDLCGGHVVVVDVLRASITILTALHNGAQSIRPCLTVDDAMLCRNRTPGILLGGERGGKRIDGFDLSNSPTDYSVERVTGRQLAFTTTNGTRALLHSTAARSIEIGSFVNAGCLATGLQNSREPLHILCAGTDGKVTGEDALFAGCLTHRLLESAPTESVTLSDITAMVLGYWRQQQSQRSLSESLMDTQGGRNLQALGYESDVETAAAINSIPVRAVYCVETDLITRRAS